MKVSVIIPVYNGERYLRACIDSVLNQTWRDFELICVDDGSTDGTAAILEDSASGDARIRVLHRPHSDAGSCRNAGYDAANGDALAFLDADDVFSPRLLEVLVDGLVSQDADVSICGRVGFRGDDPVPPMADGRSPDWEVRDLSRGDCDVFRDVSSCAWDKVFRRTLVERHGIRFLSTPSSNDFTFVISTVAVAGRCALTDLPLVAHRYHPLSIQATRCKSPEFFFRAVEACRREMGRTGALESRPWVWNRFREYYLEHFYWQLGTMRTAEAYDVLRRQAIAAEPSIRIGTGERLTTLLGRRRLRRYAAMLSGRRWETVESRLERRIASRVGDYELAFGWRRLVKRLSRWAIMAAFDPLLPIAKAFRRR